MYTEAHHVTPKCLGGDDSTDNIVRLTPEEHYVAHQLLVKLHPGSPKVLFAALMMTVDARGKRGSNKKYGWLKRRFSENQRGAANPGVSEQARKKNSEAKKGKPSPRKGVILSEETKKRISDSKKNPTEETREKLRKASLGRVNGPPSEETKQKLRESQLGKSVSTETRQKMREAWERRRLSGIKSSRNPLSNETKQKIRETLSGRKLPEETKQKIRDALRRRKETK